MDYITQYARGCGKLPDRYWYQLGGQSAQQNWIAQRQEILDAIAEQEDDTEVIEVSAK